MKHRDVLQHGNAKAVAEMRNVFKEGVQVERSECQKFLAWQLVCEHAVARMQVQVGVRILDAVPAVAVGSIPGRGAGTRAHCAQPRPGILRARTGQGHPPAEG